MARVRETSLAHPWSVPRIAVGPRTAYRSEVLSAFCKATCCFEAQRDAQAQSPKMECSISDDNRSETNRLGESYKIVLCGGAAEKSENSFRFRSNSWVVLFLHTIIHLYASLQADSNRATIPVISLDRRELNDNMLTDPSHHLVQFQIYRPVSSHRASRDPSSPFIQSRLCSFLPQRCELCTSSVRIQLILPCSHCQSFLLTRRTRIPLANPFQPF
jgi:hypothetical protein